MSEVRLTEEEIEICNRIAGEHGIVFLLDHLGLDSLGNQLNEVNANGLLRQLNQLYETVEIYCARGVGVQVVFYGGSRRYSFIGDTLSEALRKALGSRAR